jgi:CBS domain containing-hemolysin-like protein
MANLILAVILLLLALAGLVVRKTYYYLPVHELKRRAEKHDKPAAQLYRAVAYGTSLRGLLWLYVGLTTAGSLVFLARVLPAWAGLLIAVVLLWLAFVVLPATRTTKVGLRLTMLVTPPIAWLLSYLHPLLSRAVDLVHAAYATPVHTGLFERADLEDLLKQQQRQHDSRLTDEEIGIVKQALSFGDHQVGSLMIGRKQVKTLLADDTVGPILIDEVHKSGQGQALVRETRKGPFVGTLSFQQLDLQSTGKVRDIMRPAVYYLHEQDSLSQALHAFFVTNCPLFVVVNTSEEFVGVVTIESVLHQLLGHMPGDDFDQYANLAVVAARHTKIVEDSKRPE